MKYKVDVMRIQENSTALSGRTIGKSPEGRATFRIGDEKHNPVEFKRVSTHRDDVGQIYFKKVHDKELGFDIQFPYEYGESYYLLIRCGGRQAKIRYSEDLITRRASVAYKRVGKIKDLMNMEIVHVALDFWKEHGLEALVVKSRHKLQGTGSDYDYDEWYELTKPTSEELAAQRQKNFDFEPLLSVMIPAYKTPGRYLRGILDSILEQTYTNWEMCIADGGPREQGLERVLKEYMGRDGRIRYEILGNNRRTAGSTNVALDMARGDFAILADHNSALPPHAFYGVVKAISEHPGCDVLYSDEDKLDMDRKILFDPHFKPDFNPDLLTSVNYICHLFAVRQDLLKQMGGFHQEFDRAQDYDFMFRCTEAAEHVRHTPKVLYHWRCHQDSTASNPESRMYTFETGSRAIMAHHERLGIEARCMEKGIDHGIYHTRFKIQSEPPISVIIPNKDHNEDLGVCVKSLIEKSTYRNLEFIAAENSSREKETFTYYEKMQALHSNFHVVTWEEEFNYSAINNYRAGFAKSQYLLLLNNDTELIDPDSIREVLGFYQREDMSTARARLLYENDTIQYAEVVMGLDDITGHTFVGPHKAGSSYFHRAMCVQDYSAVTAACLITKKDIFDAVGGLSAELTVAFNGIDYCMRVGALGKLVVYAPHTCFCHYESRSRGLEDIPEKVERFSREVVIFIKRWPNIIKDGDSYYNPNLTLRKSNFALRDLLREEIGEPYDLRVYQQYAPEDKRNSHE